MNALDTQEPPVSARSRSRRPQLSLEELQQLKWLLGGVLSLLAVWTVFYMDVEAWTLMGLTTVTTVAALLRPSLPARVPVLVHTLTFPGIVAFFALDLWITSEVLPAMVRLGILLILYRSISYRQRRDDLQVIVMGLFLIVVAGVLTVSLLFAAQILLYTGCALAFLLVITLTDAAEGGKKPIPHKAGELPPWAAHVDWGRLFRRLREVSDWRVVTLSAVLFAGVVAVSALLFLAIPRFQLENSLFLDRFITKKAKSGFSDTIKFGDVTEIQRDTSIALSVDVSDRTQVPASPYWRMLVLDEYRDGTFRFSPGLRRTTLGNERTDTALRGEGRPRRGESVFWTFYLESGVSRYLPLLGEFERLQFREPQNFRLAAELNVVALRDEPVSMTAYRVEGFDTSGALRDPAFARRWREYDPGSPLRSSFQNRVAVSEADQARLGQVVTEITGGSKALTTAEFAHRAEDWLRKNHGYSLSPVVPSGEGDALIRWLVSHESGHCELFAGSLVLLARTAGFPARAITGFRGGSWNGFSNNFTIRNSDAHAWAEIFDAASGSWLRADALGTAASAQSSEPRGDEALNRRTDRSWSARFDSLRVFWYRRIVNFDQSSQVETLKAVKLATQSTGERLRAWFEDFNKSLRHWVASPWDMQRIFRLLATLAMIVGLGWWWFTQGRGWLRTRLQRRESRDLDPVRATAGRWLADLAAYESGLPAEAAGVIVELQRVRFGPRETWAEPHAIFRRAKKTLRAARAVRSAPTPAGSLG